MSSFTIYYITLLTITLTKVQSINNVLELTDEDFDSKLWDYDKALVLFYAPWCRHCIRLKPEFAKAADELMRSEPPVRLAQIDCTQNGEQTCNRYELTGYPSLKIFSGGDLVEDYDGPREAEEIIKRIRMLAGPSSKELHTEDELSVFLKEQEFVCVIGYFGQETSLKDSFFRLPKEFRQKIKFAHFSQQINDFKNVVVLYRPQHLQNVFENNAVIYEGFGDDLQNFILKHYRGLVGIRTAMNKEDFKLPQVICYYTIDYRRNPKGTNYWRNRILKVAKNHQTTNLTFGISSKEEFQNDLEEFNVNFDECTKPLVFAIDQFDRKFVMEADFSVQAFALFVKNMLEGTLTPYVKSQPVPETNDGPVKVAVAKNFDEVVVENGNDTFLIFYAPWCTYCHKVLPIIENLAEKLANEDVVIVKMDGTSNDIPPPYKIRGYPAIYWANKDSKGDPIEYVGGRTLEDFIEYISRYSTEELRGYDREGETRKEQKQKQAEL